ncbi:MAG: calcium-binding protein [Chloroflexota bacterium]|jgi:hypothetical protein
MKKWLLITGVLVGSLLNIPSPTHARSPERPKVAQPACTITGTARNDVLRGTNNADVICGLGGNDVIHGFGGDDTLIGGVGNDTLHGGAGNDSLRGDAGNDTLVGNGGDDSVVGGNGNDRLDGSDGRDAITGDVGTDTLVGGTGDDVLNGGAGRDQVNPGPGTNYCAPDGSDVTIGRCMRDTKAPVFAPMALSRSVSAGQTAVFEWTVEDETSIITFLRVIGGTTGWVNWCGYDVFGNPITVFSTPDALPVASSGFRVECRVPTNAVNGDYAVEFHAFDAFNNYATQRVILNVENGAVDTDAPTISNVNVSDIDSTNTFGISFRVDDATGIETVFSFLADNNGDYRDSNGNSYARNLTSTVSSIPVDNDGAAMQYLQIMILNNRAPIKPGEYTVWISVRDTLGNTEFIKTDATVNIR